MNVADSARIEGVDPSLAEQWCRTYDPMLERLQSALEAEFGPLTWSPLARPALARRHDQARAVRIGAINATGVPVPELDLAAISAAVDTVLTAHGFPSQPPMTGSMSGELICTATDAAGAEFTLLIKMDVNAWIDVRL